MKSALFILLFILLTSLPFHASAESNVRYLNITSIGTYEWMTSDRTLISSPKMNAQGLIPIVPVKGVSQYLLVISKSWQYSLTITAECWEKPQAAFEACIDQYDYMETPERIAANNKAIESYNKKQAKKQARVSWVYEEIKPSQVEPILMEFSKAHRRWLKENEAKINAQINANQFNCVDMSAEMLQRTHTSEPKSMSKLEAEISAVKKGNWQVASRMVIDMLDHQDWESAYPVIAWMIHQQAPAAYNRMAQLIAVTSSYEHGHSSPHETSIIHSLHWHGAMLGDSGSQAMLAYAYEEQKGKEKLVESLQQCAAKQRAGYGR